MYIDFETDKLGEELKEKRFNDLSSQGIPPVVSQGFPPGGGGCTTGEDGGGEVSAAVYPEDGGGPFPTEPNGGAGG